MSKIYYFIFLMGVRLFDSLIRRPFKAYGNYGNFSVFCVFRCARRKNGDQVNNALTISVSILNLKIQPG